MEIPSEKKSFFERNHFIIKFGIIGLLALLLLIPVAFIQNIIWEREQLKSTTQLNIQAMWGSNQKIVTPILVIPFKETLIDEKQKATVIERDLFLSGEKVNIDCKVTSEKRQKGIFSTIVYTDINTISGNFDISKIPNDSKYTYDFNNARFVFGLTDPGAISSKVKLIWNNEPTEVKPGSHWQTIAAGAFAKIILKPEIKTYSYTLNFEMRGSATIEFVPACKEADITMTANWPSPSFTGKNLPKSRNITGKGFDAHWSTNEFNNAMLDNWTRTDLVLSNKEAIVSVAFVETANDYQKNTRSSKYALLIIALSFTTFFIFEFYHKRKIHPIQYTFIGFALAIFYLLLISLTEHLGYNISYIISALAVIAIITIYARAIIKNLKSTLILVAVLIFLYAYIFILLQLEDYALLVGSIGLFMVLAGIMISSRKIDWYKEGNDG